MLENSGVEITRKSLDMVQGNLRLLGDRLLIKELPVPLGVTIHAMWRGKPVRGLVVASGPGEYPKRYNPDRSKTWPSKAFLATQVKVGDIVHLGGLEIGGYSFPHFLLNGEDHLIVSEKDVTGIEEKSDEPTD